MSEQETVKVYELAKELGMDSISLLDRLKSLNIQVKNHMSDLQLDEARIARTSLKAPAEAEKPAKRSTKTAAAKTTTAKTATKTAAPKTAVAKSATKTAAPKAATATRTRKKVEEAPAEEAPKAASPIIRRRLKADGETETLTPAALKRPVSTEEEPSYSDEETQSYEADQQTSDSETYQEQFESTETEQHSVQASGVETSAPETTAPETASAAPTNTDPQAPRQRPAVVLTPRPVAPRRSILKTFEPIVIPPKPVVKAAPIVPGAKPGVIAPKTTSTANPERDGNSSRRRSFRRLP
jgi:chemotaxis protein histidine kinase CheA